MASFVFTPTKFRFASKLQDLTDVRVILCMTNQTVSTHEDASHVADLVLDEMDGANYARKAVAGESISEDDTNNRAVFTFNPVTWTALGNGTRQVKGMVLYQQKTNDSDSELLAWIEPSGWPINPGGSDFTATPNAAGVLQFT